jgi:hypothetical protein
MLTCQIRNILAVPETFRAMPQKNKPQRNHRSEIPQSLITRQQHLKEAGIASGIRWDKLSKEYYLVYKDPGVIPAWS